MTQELGFHNARSVMHEGFCYATEFNSSTCSRFGVLRPGSGGGTAAMPHRCSGSLQHRVTAQPLPNRRRLLAATPEGARDAWDVSTGRDLRGHAAGVHFEGPKFLPAWQSPTASPGFRLSQSSPRVRSATTATVGSL